MTGVFDIKECDLSNWFIRNHRYHLYWYTFAAICVSAVAWYFHNELIIRKNHKYGKFIPISTAFLMMMFTLEAFMTVDGWGIKNKERINLQLNEYLYPIKFAMKNIPKGKKVLLEPNLDGLNYYLHNQAIPMYSRQTWGIVQAKNTMDVKSEIENLKIGAIAIMGNIFGGISSWYDMPLFKFLDNPKNAHLIHNNESWRVYLIKE